MNFKITNQTEFDNRKLLDKEIKKAWIEALRSGKYKQGRMCLKRDNEYCCLGVLCEINNKLEEFGCLIGTSNNVFSGVINSNINIGQTVQQLVAKARLKEALDKLKNNENQNEVIQLQSRLSKLERNVMLGQLSNSEENMERNKITFAILQLSNFKIDEDKFFYVEQPYIKQEMNKYQNLSSKTDCAVELLRFFNEISKSPANRLRVNVIQKEVSQCQEVMKYTKLQTLLGVIATLSINPKVDNFHDIVFKTAYDEMVTSMINTLTTYISVADKHATTNELPSEALSGLENDKTVKSLKRWVESLKRACGSRVNLSDKLVDKLDYWLHYTKDKDEDEFEIIVDNQIIPDFIKYCNKNEI